MLGYAKRKLRQLTTCVQERFSHSERLYILGTAPGSIALYHSDKKRYRVIVSDTATCDGRELSDAGIQCLHVSTYAAAVKQIIENAVRKRRRSILIVNTASDEENLSICRTATEIISSMSTQERDGVTEYVSLYVFGNVSDDRETDVLVTAGQGCVTYVHRDRRLAIDWVDRYPLAAFLTEKQMDVRTSLLSGDAEIHVWMLGFCDLMRQMYHVSVVNNQFISAGEGDPRLHPVQYHLCGDDEEEMHRFLHDTFARHTIEAGKAYLPLPDPVAETTCHSMEMDAISEVLRALAVSDKNAIHFIIVDVGTDEENIHAAEHLLADLKGGVGAPVFFFVHVGGEHIESSIFAQKNCFRFGCEAEVLYHIDRLTDDPFSRMAQIRNEAYDIEYDLSSDPTLTVDETYLTALRMHTRASQYKETRMERESGYYGCLSLRSKLNMMGLDYEPIGGEGRALSEAEYLSVYAAGDMPRRRGDSIPALGKPITTYTLDFPPSHRRNLAVHEHHRWNAYMTMHGIIPATIDEILHEKSNVNGKEKYTNGKNYAAHRHGNITTFEGLIAFRQMIADRDGADEAVYDVIKYDYQLLDDAYWLLQKCGYQIIPMKNKEKQ